MKKESLLYEEALSKMSSEEKQLRDAAADILTNEMGLVGSAVSAIYLQDCDLAEVKEVCSNEVCILIEGLNRVSSVNKNMKMVETENFRKLLLALAEDVRVVLIIIARRLALMRYLNTQGDSDYRKEIAKETSFLYAPLAHRLGLYAIKTELEDLSLKFSEYAVYKDIARALNEKKQQRDAYIEAFIGPVQEKLESLGLKFHIKGRTKSIHSIYNKMQKQQCGVDGIYDLFAIRIILQSEPEKEKAECWQVYSVIADMYQPNPKRLRDWLSIPKSNGYESLHTTVLGPEGKWVEVQIRTERMDEIAEKGVAAHWKYKGGKSEEGLDAFLKSVREMLESDATEKSNIEDFKLNLYEKEVFVFTPNGDLHKLPQGATVLDFAFAIHSGLGCRCVGGKIGGKNVPIKYILHNGDQVEVLTSPMQKPTEAWLKIVMTAKAKNKIRQALKEIEYKNAAEGRELLERRFKNWKIEYDETAVSHLSKKLGYKAVSDFYQGIAQGKVDMLLVKDRYIAQQEAVNDQSGATGVSAQNFVPLTDNQYGGKRDELVIDGDLGKVEYKLAGCCKPIYGDDIFGFVSVTSGIKIHRKDCPNASDMKARYPYRIVPARWSGKAVGSNYPITLKVVGQDDIGIVSAITSLINKENGVLLRTISIDSHDGIFEGHLTLLLASTAQLESIKRKISGVKGVKEVVRS